MAEISGILIFLVGGIIGFVICRITLGTKPTATQQRKLDNSKAELDHYKSEINKHFTSSAELMGQVASSYQALYTHMAGQSQALLGDSDADALPFAQLTTPSEKKEEEPLVAKDAEQETAEKKEEEPLVAKDSAQETADKKEEEPLVAKDAEQETAKKATSEEAQTNATAETGEDEKAPKNHAAESSPRKDDN